MAEVLENPKLCLSHKTMLNGSLDLTTKIKYVLTLTLHDIIYAKDIVTVELFRKCIEEIT